MATTAKIERTDVPGAVPNVTDSTNTSYIEPGALFINVTDEKLYSSNGTSPFEINSNNASYLGGVPANEHYTEARITITSSEPADVGATSNGHLWLVYNP